MQIVTEISGIMGEHVNLMDEKGVIIASTDPTRLGTYHEGAWRVISQNLDELVIRDDATLAGSKRGINLPVRLDGEIVGVVGMTGEHDEVVKYGQIIKKMTEILLLENNAQDQKKIDERIRTRFLDEWLFEGMILDSQAFIERGARLGIDVLVPRRVLVAEITELKSDRDSPAGQRLIDSVNKTVRRMMEEIPHNIFAKTASQMICLIVDCSNAAMRAIALEIGRRVEQRFGLSLRIGIDAQSRTPHHACQRARKALAACTHTPGGAIRFYEDINLEIFMDEISEFSKIEFVRRIFRGCDEEEIASWVRLLQVYFDCDGAIGHASTRLFIHKNTLQYKLRRLCEQTGYDPRVLSDAALYYLAIQFHLSNKEEHDIV